MGVAFKPLMAYRICHPLSLHRMIEQSHPKTNLSQRRLILLPGLARRCQDFLRSPVRAEVEHILVAHLL